MVAEPLGLRQRWERVQEQVQDAVARAGRSADEITTIVVTKFHPVTLIRDLVELGVRDIGENREQEARAKVAELGDIDLTWHFLGQIQTNKARRIAEWADVLHAVDRPALLPLLSAGGHERDVFLQVNLTDDPTRGGVAPTGVADLADQIAQTEGLVLRGLMAVAPLGAPPRPAFARVHRLSEELQRTHPRATGLSMGMSGDFEAAILEGATHLRIGTAITGNRPERG